MGHDVNNIMVILSSPSGARENNNNKKNSTKISIIQNIGFSYDAQTSL